MIIPCLWFCPRQDYNEPFYGFKVYFNYNDSIISL